MAHPKDGTWNAALYCFTAHGIGSFFNPYGILHGYYVTAFPRSGTAGVAYAFEIGSQRPRHTRTLRGPLTLRRHTYYPSFGEANKTLYSSFSTFPLHVSPFLLRLVMRQHSLNLELSEGPMVRRPSLLLAASCRRLFRLSRFPNATSCLKRAYLVIIVVMPQQA
jgi:hypothetical protein